MTLASVQVVEKRPLLVRAPRRGHRRWWGAPLVGQQIHDLRKGADDAVQTTVDAPPIRRAHGRYVRIALVPPLDARHLIAHEAYGAGVIVRRRDGRHPLGGGRGRREGRPKR